MQHRSVCHQVGLESLEVRAMMSGGAPTPASPLA
jgi:hypothetical protein